MSSDMDLVNYFNSELSSLYDVKPPISKGKMTAITKSALKAVKLYKHVVQSVEKFIQKCRPEYKIPGLYVIDSIIRQSRHQFGVEKDIFAPRFSRNLKMTFVYLYRCPDEDRARVIRVLNLWQKNKIFPPSILAPLFDLADPSNPIWETITLPNLAMDSSSIGGGDKGSNGNLIFSGEVQFKSSLLDYDYEEEADEEKSPEKMSSTPALVESSEQESSKIITDSAPPSTGLNNPPPLVGIDAIGSILNNPEVLRQLQTLQEQMTAAAQASVVQQLGGYLTPEQERMRRLAELNKQEAAFDQRLAQTVARTPFASECNDFIESQEQSRGALSPPPPALDISKLSVPPPSHFYSHLENPNPFGIPLSFPLHQFTQLPPSSTNSSQEITLPNPPPSSGGPYGNLVSENNSSSGPVEIDLTEEKDEGKERRRRRSRSRSRTRRSHRSRSRERREEKERVRKGFAPSKKEHLSICTTTLWVGHLSKLVTQEELSDSFGAYGDVVSIELISSRGCAFVVMNRRQDAARALERLRKTKLQGKEITIAWAPGKGVKGREWKDYWEVEFGVSYIPWNKLKEDTNTEEFEDGGCVDESTLPLFLKNRPKKEEKVELGLDESKVEGKKEENIEKKEENSINLPIESSSGGPNVNVNTNLINQPLIGGQPPPAPVPPPIQNPYAMAPPVGMMGVPPMMGMMGMPPPMLGGPMGMGFGGMMGPMMGLMPNGALLAQDHSSLLLAQQGMGLSMPHPAQQMDPNFQNNLANMQNFHNNLPNYSNNLGPNMGNNMGPNLGAGLLGSGEEEGRKRSQPQLRDKERKKSRFDNIDGSSSPIGSIDRDDRNVTPQKTPHLDDNLFERIKSLAEGFGSGTGPFGNMVENNSGNNQTSLLGSPLRPILNPNLRPPQLPNRGGDGSGGGGGFGSHNDPSQNPFLNPSTHINPFVSGGGGGVFGGGGGGGNENPFEMRRGGGGRRGGRGEGDDFFDNDRGNFGNKRGGGGGNMFGNGPPPPHWRGSPRGPPPNMRGGPMGRGGPGGPRWHGPPHPDFDPPGFRPRFRPHGGGGGRGEWEEPPMRRRRSPRGGGRAPMGRDWDEGRPPIGRERDEGRSSIGRERGRDEGRDEGRNSIGRERDEGRDKSEGRNSIGRERDEGRSYGGRDEGRRRRRSRSGEEDEGRRGGRRRSENWDEEDGERSGERVAVVEETVVEAAEECVRERDDQKMDEDEREEVNGYHEQESFEPSCDVGEFRTNEIVVNEEHVEIREDFNTEIPLHSEIEPEIEPSHVDVS